MGGCVTFRLPVPIDMLADVIEQARPDQGEPWPMSLAVLYLALRQDEAMSPSRHARPFPSLAELTATLGWKTRNGTPARDRVRGLLRREELWATSDPARAATWAALMGQRRKQTHSKPTANPPQTHSKPTKPTREPEESGSKAHSKPTPNPQQTHSKPNARGKQTTPPLLHSSTPTESTAHARSSSLDTSTAEVWLVFVDGWLDVHGARLGPKPPKAVGLRQRIRDYGREDVELVISWWRRSMDDRATFLREQRIGARTLFGARKFGEYLDGWARPWSEGRSRAPPRRTTTQGDTFTAELDKLHSDLEQSSNPLESFIRGGNHGDSTGSESSDTGTPHGRVSTPFGVGHPFR